MGRIGDLLAARYRLEQSLGRGGMATVWRARDEVLNRPVAVKVMAEGAMAEAEAVERFRREAHTIAGFHHPHIVTLFDAGLEDHTPFLVMELVDGTSLDQLIQGGPLPIARAVAIADQICAALGAAHQAGIIHRDIKPANVLLTSGGMVKVVDFGIARAAEAAHHTALTATSTVMGTGLYMAPEQATGQTVDARTDLYAMGCVLYEMLTGQPPFPGDDPLAVLYQHLYEAPRPPRQTRPDIPAALEQLVMGLLAKDPDQRPADAEHVRSRLTAAEPPAPTRALPPLQPPNARSSGRRRTVALAAAAFVAAAAIGYLINNSASPSSSRVAGAALSPAPAASTPAGSAPTASPAATPLNASLPPTGTVADVLAAIRQQQDVGNLTPAGARQLRHQLGELNQQMEQGNTKDAAHKIQDIRHHLADLRHGGQITAGGARQITTALTALADTLPAHFGDNSDG